MAKKATKEVEVKSEVLTKKERMAKAKGYAK